MAEGKSKEAWNHTAALMAHMINTNPFRKKHARLVDPKVFHPFYQSRRNRHAIRAKSSIESFAAMMCDQRPASARVIYVKPKRQGPSGNREEVQHG